MDQQYGTNIDTSINGRLESAMRPLFEHMEHEQQYILPVLESRLSKEGPLHFHWNSYYIIKYISIYNI